MGNKRREMRTAAGCLKQRHCLELYLRYDNRREVLSASACDRIG